MAYPTLKALPVTPQEIERGRKWGLPKYTGVRDQIIAAQHSSQGLGPHFTVKPLGGNRNGFTRPSLGPFVSMLDSSDPKERALGLGMPVILSKEPPVSEQELNSRAAIEPTIDLELAQKLGIDPTLGAEASQEALKHLASENSIPSTTQEINARHSQDILSVENFQSCTASEKALTDQSAEALAQLNSTTVGPSPSFVQFQGPVQGVGADSDTINRASFLLDEQALNAQHEITERATISSLATQALSPQPSLTDGSTLTQKAPELGGVLSALLDPRPDELQSNGPSPSNPHDGSFGGIGALAQAILPATAREGLSDLSTKLQTRRSSSRQPSPVLWSAFSRQVG